MTRVSLARKRALAVALIVCLVLCMPVTGVFAQAPAPTATPAPESPEARDLAVQRAVAYLATQQVAGGGIDAFATGAADPTGTALTVLALAAVGQPEAIPGLLDYLAKQAGAYTHPAGKSGAEFLFPSRAGLLLAAVAAVNADPRDLGGLDLLGELQATLDPETGAYATEAAEEFTGGAASDVNQAWALLGLTSAGVAVPEAAVEYLLGTQGEDGSWGGGDPDTTARALAALLATGQVEPAAGPVENAIAWLRATQLENGGWRPAWDSEPLNADTTGWVVQALIAAGYAPPTVSWQAAGGDPVGALLGLQQEGGQIGGAYANAYSTAEALLGLSDRAVTTPGRAGRVGRALTWLASRQEDAGGWAGLSGADAGTTSEVLLAYAAAGIDPATVRTAEGRPSALDYVEDAVAGSYAATSPAAAGKVTVALAACGVDVADVGGVDLGDVLAREWYSPTLSAYGTVSDTLDTWAQSWAILGTRAAGAEVPEGAVETLVGLQQADGHWTDAWGYSAPDSTGLALQALMAAGRAPDDPAVARGVAYLQAARDASGGWENANATATAIQGLLAAGEVLLTSSAWRVNGRTPLDALAALQKSDGPFVWMWENPYGPDADNVLATSQAVPALLGVHYPLTAGTLNAWSPTPRGPDPDRLVVVSPRLSGEDGVSVTLPCGSDANRYATVAVDYRPLGASDWITGTAVARAPGAFEATLPLSTAASYEIQVTAADADGVQSGGTVQPSFAFTLTREASEPTPAPPAGNLATEAWVGLVVRMDEARTEIRTVPYREGMNGLDVLTASGLEVVAAYSGLGAAVCSIDGQGCPADNCFCASPDTWSYWHLQEGRWVYSPVGATAYIVQPGDVQGWAWGNAAPPPILPLEAIFAAEPTSAPPTDTPAVVATPVADASPTPTAPAAQQGASGTAYWLGGGVIVVLLVAAFLVPRLRRGR